jgi:hypothetical protein
MNAWTPVSETKLRKGKRKIKVVVYTRDQYDPESGRTHSEGVVHVEDLVMDGAPSSAFRGAYGSARAMAYKDGVVDALACVDKWKVEA